MIEDNIFGLHYANREPKPEPEPEQPKKRYNNSPDDVVEHLKNFHRVNVPDDFSEQLLIAHTQYHGSSFDFPKRTVDTIVRACRKWVDYVEDIDSLICKEILSMVRIHVSVIWARSLNKYGFALKKEVPFTRETIVTYTGALKVYQ